MNDDELQRRITMLNGDIDQIKEVLEFSLENPLGDARLLTYLESMLDDRRLCVMGVPYYYGELRWLVAEAVASEQGKLGIDDGVYLKNTFRPMRTEEINKLAQNAGIDMKLKSFEKLQILVQLGKVPLHDRAFPSRKKWATS